jgi:hypothetical protein
MVEAALRLASFDSLGTGRSLRAERGIEPASEDAVDQTITNG